MLFLSVFITVFILMLFEQVEEDVHFSSCNIFSFSYTKIFSNATLIVSLDEYSSKGSTGEHAELYLISSINSTWSRPQFSHKVSCILVSCAFSQKNLPSVYLSIQQLFEHNVFFYLVLMQNKKKQKKTKNPNSDQMPAEINTACCFRVACFRQNCWWGRKANCLFTWERWRHGNGESQMKVVL